MCNKPYPLYEVEEMNNLKELVNIVAEKYGDNTAFTFERNKETISISYRQFKSDVDSLGTALFDMGIENTKVALIGENSYEWILTYFATVNSGNVIVPLDKELPASDVKALVDHAEAEVFVYSDTYADLATHLQESSTAVRHYLNKNGLKKLIEESQASIQKDKKQVADYIVDENVLATLSYTSGTTGNAKGVMLSHRSITRNAVGICQSVDFLDASLLVLPLHHASGFMGALCMLIYGSAIGINGSLKSLQGDFSKYKPESMVLVPLFIETLYKQILAAAKGNTDKAVLASIANKVFGGDLSIIICGAAPLDPKYVDIYADWGIALLNVYGLTECSGAISINRNHYNRAGSAGLVVPYCEVKISNLDENGCGEVWSRGENIMLGYYKNEQATAETFDDEWFKTGDIGYLDDDGFLFITGRKKNVIILSNGKNVYPEELEFALINQIPYIKEVVVYADNDMIIAEVFLDTENMPDCVSRLDEDIINFNKTQAMYKNVAKTIVRDSEFPKTTTKKIKRQR